MTYHSNMFNFPNANISQFAVVSGFIQADPFITPHNYDKTTWYCGFKLTTYRIDGKFTAINCYIEGNQAKTFYDNFKKFDTITVYGELTHAYNGVTSENRVHVLGWASPLATKNIPTLSEDETEAVNEFLNLYRSKVEKPTQKEIDFIVERKKRYAKKNY